MKELKKLSVYVNGDRTSDLEEALQEVINLLQCGFTEGQDSNETGNYFFKVRAFECTENSDSK